MKKKLKLFRESYQKCLYLWNYHVRLSFSRSYQAHGKCGGRYERHVILYMFVDKSG